MTYLAVRNWWKFQHYKSGRGAPWLKLYAALFDDRDFTALPDAAQGQLIKIWMYRKLHGALPNNPKWLAGKIGVNGKSYIALLIERRWLVVTDQLSTIEGEQITDEDASTDASKVDSKDASKGTSTTASKPARPPFVHARALEVERKETSTTQSVSPRAMLLGRFAADLHRTTLSTLLDAVPHEPTWIAALTAQLDNMRGNEGATPQELGDALVAYVANVGTNTPNWAHFRGYVRRVQKGERPDIAPASRGGARNDENLGGWLKEGA